jgi:hypothetical protein
MHENGGQDDRRPMPTWIRAVAALGALLTGIASLVYVIVLLRGITPTAAPPVPVGPEPPILSSEPSRPTPLPTSDGSLQPQLVIEPIKTVSVPGRLANGVQFTAERTGTYRFAYDGGAYAVYRPGSEPKGFRPWLTAVCVFSGDGVPFDGEVLQKDRAVLRVADNEYAASEKAAIDLATGGSWFETNLTAGQTVTLVGVDHLYSYGDNPGAVRIEISLVTRPTA